MRPLRAFGSVLVSVVLSAVSACETLAPASQTPAEPEPIATLAAAMIGSYSSADQARADPEFRDIRLQMARIWRARPDGPWLYIEQAAAGSLDKPYRQRIYQLSLSNDPARPDGTIESRVYELPGDPLAFAGAWSDATRFDPLRKEDLLPRQGCTVYLTAHDDGTWEGETGADSCASSLRGASYATSHVTISSTELRSWDRGFDKDGKQVWGAVKGPYHFIKQADVKAPVPAAQPAKPKIELVPM